MKNNKIAWILFSVMTIVVVILSSVMIAQSVKWKTGEELLNMTPNDVESATATYKTSGPSNFVRTIQLDEKQIEYIVYEFNRSLFERDEKSVAEGGSVTIEFTLKDGSKKELYFFAGVTIDGKKYKCHSYLGRYCYGLFYTEE